MSSAQVPTGSCATQCATLYMIGMPLLPRIMARSSCFATNASRCLSVRIFIEEDALRKGLPGYADYAARVRYRLIPGVW